GDADDGEAVRPSDTRPRPRPRPPPIAAERVVEQLEKLVGDRLRCGCRPQLPQEPHGNHDEQRAAPVIHRDAQHAGAIGDAFARLDNRRRRVAVREIEHRDDAVASRGDESHADTGGAAHQQAHPEFPDGQAEPRACRLRRNRQRSLPPRTHLRQAPRRRHGYLRLLRALPPDVSGAGSASVITVLPPRVPHGGGAPSPTRMVSTGNGGASLGHGVRQSLTMTSRSIAGVLPSMNVRRPTPMSVPPPPYSSTCAAVNTRFTLCTAPSQHATTTSAP